MAVEKDQEFVEYLAKQLVEKPEAVKVNRTVDEMGVLLELTVDKDDMGVIIGKEGKSAKAIRTLLRVLGAKNDARVNLKIVEPEGSERPAPKPDLKGDSPSTDAQDAAKPTKEAIVEKEEEPAVEEVQETPVAEVVEDDDERPMADLDL